MSSRLLGFAFVVFFFAGQSLAFQIGAKLRKIDVEKRVAVIFANGQERVLKFSDDAKVQNEQGKDLEGGLSAKELKAETFVTLHVERDGNAMMIKSIRLGGKLSQQKPTAPSNESVGRTSVGFKPLTEMTAEDRYKGEDGGLYGGGRNEMPVSLRAAAKKESTKIISRDAMGNPAGNGQIGLVSISMSNATQEFSKFKQLADADAEKSASVTIVDCAQGRSRGSLLG
jgi:hypothetical protein